MKMNNLNMCIQEVARDDLRATRAITSEINGYLHGDIGFSQLSFLAQYAIELANTDDNDNIAYNAGRFNFSDVKDLLAF